ncbi:MAG: hypothetical protein U0271_13735 [Polyangiaceae bacterium]
MRQFERFGCIAAACALVLCAASEARAEDETPPPVVGSLVLGTLPFPVANDALDIASSIALSDFGSDATVELGPAVGLGVTDWLSVGAALPISSQVVSGDRSLGLGHVSVGASVLLYQDARAGFAFGFVPALAFPSPEDDATTFYPKAGLSAAIRMGTLALNLSARGNLAVSPESDTNPDAEVEAAVDGVVSLLLVHPTWAPFLELQLEVDQAGGLTPAAATGLNWIPLPSTILTLGAPIVFDSDGPHPGLQLLATFEASLSRPRPRIIASAPPQPASEADAPQ